MDLKRFWRRYKQFGGIRLVGEYVRMGLVPLCCREMMRVVMRRCSPMEAYGHVMVRVGLKLKERYWPVLEELENSLKLRDESLEFRDDGIEGASGLALEHEHPKVIWFCWLQGMENAPELVKVCYHSLMGLQLMGYEVKVVDGRNWREYVELPDDIVKKVEKGIIPMAHFTDLLRLELLIKYGGTWVDSTVLCTGFNGLRSSSGSRALSGLRVEEYLEADLFLFQQLRKGETRFLGISNWFISSCTDNWVLKILRDILYQYWRDYDCVVDYYMFHLFFSMIMEKHPEVAAKMPRYGNGLPHCLQRRMGDQYDEVWMEELKKRTCFHKLSYRLDKSVLESKGTFYDVVIKQAIKN